MSFNNPIVGSQNALIRDAIRSRNYVPGSAGWSINKNGSAEFNDVTINGGELLVSDPDGSFVRIYDQNPGDGAVIEMQPADQPGDTISPAYLLTRSFSTFASVDLVAPNFNSAPGASISLASLEDVPDYSWLQLDAGEISGSCDLFYIFNNGADPRQFQVIYNPGDPSTIEVDEKTLGFEVANIHMLTPPSPAALTSATPITIGGASTTTYNKKNPNTRTEITMSAGGYITAGAGASVTFGVLISGGIGDFSIVKGSFSSLSNRLQFSGTRLLSAFAAGSYTITPRWFRSAGTSTIIMDASDASLTVAIREVIEA